MLWGLQIIKFRVMWFSPTPPLPRYLLGANVLLSTIISNITSLRTSIHVTDQTSHTSSPRGKIKASYDLR
jgi:hypothetical protein